MTDPRGSLADLPNVIGLQDKKPLNVEQTMDHLIESLVLQGNVDLKGVEDVFTKADFLASRLFRPLQQAPPC